MRNSPEAQAAQSKQDKNKWIMKDEDSALHQCLWAAILVFTATRQEICTAPAFRPQICFGDLLSDSSLAQVSMRVLI